MIVRTDRRWLAEIEHARDSGQDLDLGRKNGGPLQFRGWFMGRSAYSVAYACLFNDKGFSFAVRDMGVSGYYM